MLSNRSASTVWLITVSTIAIVLVLVSVLLNVLLDGKSEDLLPADSPEGTVQRYLRAIADDDVTVAYGYLSSDLQTACTLQHFIQSTEYYRSRDFGARLRDTVEIDETRVVSAEISEPDGGSIFGNRGFDFTTTYTLAIEGGEWRMSEPPWPMGWCPMEPGEIVPRLSGGFGTGNLDDELPVERPA
jgi:hypothetical protein